MSALRLSRVALRARSAVVFKPVQRRGYAEAVADKIKLSLALPHQVRGIRNCRPRAEHTETVFDESRWANMHSSLSTPHKTCTFATASRIGTSSHAIHEAAADDHNYSVQVNIPAESGEMGILAQHVPSIEQLKPGLVEIIEESGGSKQFFRTSSWHI